MNTESPAGVRGTRRRARFLRAGVIAAALVFAATGAVGASAAPAPTQGSGTLPPNPVEGGREQAAVLSGVSTVAKAQFAFALPLQVQRVYPSVKTDFTSDPNRFFLTNWGFVVTNPGPDQTYGAFPPVTTIVPAFGALPVQTTVYLTQVADASGVLDPIVIFSAIDNNQPNGSETTVKAKVNVRVDGVTIDKVPLDVGPNCSSVRPVDLVLTGKAAATNTKPGEYSPILGGTLSGTFTLPPFSGCGSAGQDLDPLLSGTVSGPDNKIVLIQSALGEYNPDYRYNCQIEGTRKPCKVPPQPDLPSPTGG